MPVSMLAAVFLITGCAGISAIAGPTMPPPAVPDHTSTKSPTVKAATKTNVSTETPKPSPTELPTATSTATRTWIPTTTPAMADPFAPVLPAYALGRLGKGGIAAMDLAPDERHLAVASDIGIYLYETDVNAGAMKEVWFQPTTRAAVSVAFSHDGRTVAAGLQGKTETEYYCDPHFGGGGILILEAASGKLIQFLNQAHMGSPHDLAFTPDGSALLYLNYGDAFGTGFIWKLGDPEPKAIADTAGKTLGAWDLAMSPDGKWLALSVWNPYDPADIKTEILIQEIATKRIVHRLKVPETSTRTMRFSPDSRKLAAADANDYLRVWDMSTGGETASTVIPDMRQLRFAPDNRRIFIRAADGIRLWDSAEYQTVWSLTTHTRGISVSYDGLRLLSFDENALTVWNAGNGKEIRDYLLAGHEALNDPVYSADGREIITVTNLGNIMIWDALRRTLLWTFNVGRSWFDFSIAANNRTMAVTRGDSVQIWDYRQGKPVRTHAMPKEGVREIAISPDGGAFAAASEKNIYLFDAVSGEILMQQASAGGVAFSPDGRLLAFSSADSAKIILWNIQQGAISATLDYGYKYGTSNLDFSPDGLHLGMAGYGPRVMWWSIADPKRRTNPEIDRWYPSLDIAFSPDGRTGAIGSYDILIWELASLRRLRVLTGHACYPTRLVYSPDGAVLASGSADGTVLLWDMASAIREYE